MVEQYERLLLASVDRRLRADVPVAAYLSGGVDSSTIVAMASKVLGRPIPTFTISVQSKGLNEESEAAQTARHVGSQSIVLNYGDADIREVRVAVVEHDRFGTDVSSGLGGFAFFIQSLGLSRRW